MKIEEAIRLLHPDTSADEIAEIKYKYGFRGKEQAIHKVEKACKIACKAMEKQIPKKPIKDECHHTCCPNCKWFVMEQTGWGERYLPCCENCGQAIDWSDEAIDWSDE